MKYDAQCKQRTERSEEKYGTDHTLPVTVLRFARSLCTRVMIFLRFERKISKNV